MLAHKPIAHGRTAEVYPWRDGQILKLFHDWVSTEYVQHEAHMAQVVFAAGLPVPQVGELVKIDGRMGVEYERLDGPTLGENMVRHPWTLFKAASMLAQLHATMHTMDGPAALPSQREKLVSKIRAAKHLGNELQELALARLKGMPVGDQLCHGDFHPWNVLLTQRGPIIIDWPDATRGNPLADLARTAVIVSGIRHMQELVTWKEKLLVGLFRRAYLKGYFALRPDGKAEYRAWQPLMAAGRMGEHIAGLNAWLLSQVKTGLGD